MKWTLDQSILATIAYSELFSYPLTSNELVCWLIADRVTSPATIKKHIEKIFPHKEYLGLNNLTKNIALRKKRENASKKKWEHVRKIVPFLTLIPTLQLIGISGGLSMNNSDPQDDIDLFFITLPNTLWISRFYVLVILGLTGQLRRVGDSYQKDRWCANMFITTSQLIIPKKERDIFSAHEVLQFVPVFERNNTYIRFLKENDWTKNYLANAWEEKIRNTFLDKKRYKSQAINLFLFSFYYFLLASCYVLELPVKLLQMAYMYRHRTTEIISDSVVRFHPRDIRIYIHRFYPKLLNQYKVPLDSRFLSSVQ